MNFVVLTEPFFRLPAIAVAATGFFLLTFVVAFATGTSPRVKRDYLDFRLRLGPPTVFPALVFVRPEA
jgi:hypothetical protein